MSVGFKEKVVLSCPLLSGVITRRYKAGVCDGYHIGRLLARLARAACLAEDVHRRPEPHMSHVRDAARLVGTKQYAIRDSYLFCVAMAEAGHQVVGFHQTQSWLCALQALVLAGSFGDGMAEAQYTRQFPSTFSGQWLQADDRLPVKWAHAEAPKDVGCAEVIRTSRLGRKVRRCGLFVGAEFWRVSYCDVSTAQEPECCPAEAKPSGENQRSTK
jgi:hypothetical protein